MILDCQNICKSFGTDVILNNISFHLEEKENFIATRKGILDPNTLSKEERVKLIKRENYDVSHLEYLIEGVKLKIKK